ncbi:MAG: hypothetical protein U0903_02235 [Planctomycetales bacterium]
MTKFQVLLASLVAAVPAGVLSVMLVLVFLNYGGGPNLTFQALVAATLGSSTFVTLMPLGILVFYRDGEAAVKAAAPQAAAAAIIDEEPLAASEDEELSAELQSVDLDEHDTSPEGGFDLGGFDDAPLEEEDLSTDENLIATSDEMETDDFDSFFDDEEPQGKKK